MPHDAIWFRFLQNGRWGQAYPASWWNPMNYADMRRVEPTLWALENGQGVIVRPKSDNSPPNLSL